MEFRDIDISSKSRVGLCVCTKQDFMNIIKPLSLEELKCKKILQKRKPYKQSQTSSAQGLCNLFGKGCLDLDWYGCRYNMLSTEY